MPPVRRARHWVAFKETFHKKLQVMPKSYGDTVDLAALKLAHDESPQTKRQIQKNHGLTRYHYDKIYKQEGWLPRKPCKERTGRSAAEASNRLQNMPEQTLLERFYVLLDDKLKLMEAKISHCKQNPAGMSAAESEKDAKTLMSFLQLYEKLKSMDDVHKSARIKNSPNDRPAAGGDSEGLRAELAQRLARLRRECSAR